MRRPLIGKLTGIYLLVFAALFLFANTYGTSFIEHQVVSRQKNQLYEYSQYLEEQYKNTVFDNPSLYITDSLYKQIQKTDSILDTRTWFSDANGLLLLDSNDSTAQNVQINILDYDSHYFYSSYYRNKTLEPLLSEEMLSVILPVVDNFTTKGYVIIHSPMNVIKKQIRTYMSMLNGFLFILAATFALLLFLTWYLSIRPTKKLLTAVSNYNSGVYEPTLLLHSGDEFEKMSLELSYMAEQIKDLDDYQKKFIANVSHDFRSPLTSIKGYAEAMLDGTIPEELHNKYLDIIVFETERLTKLTSNLLSLNRFESGKASLDLADFDINQIIKRTAATFEGTCVKKHVKLKLTFSEKETFVHADMAKIQQVLYNLIDNAIKFSNPNSAIHITTIEKREKVMISVKDFGMGIPKDNLKKVWERFYKTDLSRGKDKKGTGLGLSITKEIINAHDENINVTSTEGAGTEFVFTLALTTPNEI